MGKAGIKTVMPITTRMIIRITDKNSAFKITEKKQKKKRKKIKEKEKKKENSKE